jgi:hypothetical protein
MGVALLSLTACGDAPDLSKATYQRTTVPATEGPVGPSRTGATDPPRTNDEAFSAEQLRRIDPCGLFDEALLSKVGKPDDNQQSDFSQCANYMRDSAGKELNLSLTLGEGLIEDPADADEDIGGLPAHESELDDKTACFVTVVTETSPARGIRLQVGGEAEDMCGIGRTVLEAVVERIRTDPPRFDLRPGTLTEVDPCGILSDADVTAVLGDGAEATPTSLHWCTWNAGGADVWVWLRSGVDPREAADPAGSQEVDVGVPAIQESETSSSAKCDVAWSHLPLEEPFAEVVSVTFVRYTPQQGEDVCAKAQTVAKALVPKLPKK